VTAIDPSALSAFTTGSVPPIDEAALPADVRKGTKAQKQTYQAALGFEQLLVQQLAQSMMTSAGGADDSDGGSDGSDSGDGSGSTDDATSTLYQQMLPDQLASAVTSAGGIGLADQIYQSIEKGGS
jgi:Rod binding domain-containing protein